MERSVPVTEAHLLPGADAHVMITAAEAHLPGAGSPTPSTIVYCLCYHDQTWIINLFAPFPSQCNT